jgi:S1-C subfamily serine protease
MRRNIFKIISLFVLGTVGGIFADQIFWPYFVERPLFHQYRLERNPVYLTEVREITIEENTALKEAVLKADKVVVGVESETGSGEALEGSGAVITSDGLMVTLAELVPKGSQFSFYLKGEKVHFQILKRDLDSNLALVKLDRENLPTVSFADFGKLKLGERVFLLGLVPPSAEGCLVNEGIVKTFDKESITTNIREKSQLAGSSLFNIAGELLGLNTVSPEGEIVTVPADTIREFTGL